MTGKVIYNILSNAAPVSAIVANRIFPDLADQNTAYPFIVYGVEATDASDTKDGASGLDQVNVAVMVYSNSYAQAQDIARNVRTALDRTGGTFSGVTVQSIQFLNQSSAAMHLDKRVFIVEQSYKVREVQ
jgi:hypothetical protein